MSPPLATLDPTALEALPTAPIRPTAATPPDSESAASVLRYWFDTLNYAYGSGDVEPLADASEFSCGQCVSIADDVGRRRARGLVQQGGTTTVTDLTAIDHPSDDVWRFDLTLVVSAGRRWYGDGTSETIPAQSGPVRVEIVLQQPDLQGVRKLVLRSLVADPRVPG